jgi:hypothetical protein
MFSIPDGDVRPIGDLVGNFGIPARCGTNSQRGSRGDHRATPGRNPGLSSDRGVRHNGGDQATCDQRCEASAHDRSAKCQDPSLQLLRSSSPLTGPQVSGLSEPGYVLLCIDSARDSYSRQSIPSLPGKERPGCVAFILAAPPGRSVSDESARWSHRAIAQRRKMARILLKVSGNTGRPHPRLLYRESCEGAIASPDQYGSGAQRASDYGDLIKGSPQCQPISHRGTRACEAQYAFKSLPKGLFRPCPFARRLSTRCANQ